VSAITAESFDDFKENFEQEFMTSLSQSASGIYFRQIDFAPPHKWGAWQQSK